MTWVDRHGIDVNTMLHRCVDPIHFAKDAADPSPLHAQPDLIIMGQHGRKGPKERKASIGSTADQALRWASLAQHHRTMFIVT
jgi:nucleotide-binding universal stress UspA family protein